jgi:chorismate mutase/prephenate dehydratase
MAKRKSSSRASSSTSPPRAPSPADIARRLARLDRELVALVNERARVYQKAARLKRDNGQPVYEPAEESAAIDQALAHSKGPLEAAALRAVLRESISAARALVQPLRVAYLGPKYSYSHLAAVQRFGESVNLAPVATISAVFEEVNRRQADFGLVPIENSTDGRVVDTLDMFARLPVKICGEVKLRIHHYLLGKCTRDQIREVYSKPQALSQCRDWIAKHLPAVRTVEMTSTAAAAQLAVDRQGAAAVASLQAGVNYGLNVIAANIEDNRNNITRFAVIGMRPGERTGNDKTSLMFEIAHQPGALADAMAIFKRNHLNLTWIESFPMPGTKSEYLFFVELEGHPKDAKVRRALASLQRRCVRIEVLGAYVKTDVVE